MSEKITSRQATAGVRDGRAGIPEAMGQADVFLGFQEHLSRVAPIDRPVLIVGERGTGKEIAAKRLHYLSRRWDHPLVTLNCAALAESLLETELFGHEAGAFTGAAGKRIGRFEAADGGTLFLDEIGLVPVVVQEKILRVVEYGSFERVGSSTPISVDVRIVAATNVDLPRLAEEGRFKQDLLDRLSFEVLSLPPLRLRTGDIPLLTRHFAAAMALEMGLEETPVFTKRALAALEAYSWPGNVRQLKNVVERAVYRWAGRPIDRIEFDPFRETHPLGAASRPAVEAAPVGTPAATNASLLAGKSLPDAVRELEMRAVAGALEQSRHHQGKAARLLGLTYGQFRRLFRKYRDDIEGDAARG